MHSTHDADPPTPCLSQHRRQRTPHGHPGRPRRPCHFLPATRRRETAPPPARRLPGGSDRINAPPRPLRSQPCPRGRSIRTDTHCTTNHNVHGTHPSHLTLPAVSKQPPSSPCALDAAAQDAMGIHASQHWPLSLTASPCVPPASPSASPVSTKIGQLPL